MNTLYTFITFLMAPQGTAGAEQSSQQSGGGWSMMIMLILIFVVMWLFMIRPQQKKQKEAQKFREGLKKGDKVVTAGGIYGTIVETKESTAIIEIDKDVKIKVDKASLVSDFSEVQPK